MIDSKFLIRLKDPNRVLFIVGPTASGKTAISLQIAKMFQSEIISADSRQIYNFMDIGTAKEAPRLSIQNNAPRPSIQNNAPRHKNLDPYSIEGINHYLLDIVNPGTRYTLFDFQSDALDIIKNLQANGIKPIVCGGTGLYIDCLVNNYRVDSDQTENLEIKAELEKQYVDLLEKLGEEEAKKQMHTKLENLDPIRAKDFHPHNIYSVLRELEFILTNQNSKSSLAKTSKPDFEYDILLLWPDREWLYNRINHRIDLQLEQGLENETMNLYKNFPKAKTALSSLGYKQVYAYLQNPETKTSQIEEFKKLTRNYAKRQFTWFKRYKDRALVVTDPQDFHSNLIQQWSNLKSK